jgi:hypothetical protein
LETQFSVADIAAAGMVDVRVFDSTPGGGASNTLIFTIGDRVIYPAIIGR